MEAVPAGREPAAARSSSGPKRKLDRKNGETYSTLEETASHKLINVAHTCSF